MSELYKVTLIRQVQPEYTFEYAVQRLLERVQLSEAQLSKILSASNYTVIRTGDRELADRVARMIQSTGFYATLTTIQPAETPTAAAAPPAAPATPTAPGTSWRIPQLMRPLQQAAWQVRAALALPILLLALYPLSGQFGHATLEDAAEYALDRLLLSGKARSPDLQTSFARESIRACFVRKVQRWERADHALFVEAVDQLYRSGSANSNAPTYPQLLAHYPSIAAPLQAARQCPEEFLLN